MNKNNKNNILAVLTYILPILLIVIFIASFNKDVELPKEYTHGEIVEKIRSGEATDLVYEGDRLRGKLKGTANAFEVVVPETMFPSFFEDNLKDLVESGDVNLVFKEAPKPNPFLMMIPDFIFLAIMVFIIFSMYRRAQSQSGGATAFGKSKATKVLRSEGKRVTFNDVAGLKEEKEELFEIVEFLKNPRKFREVGARIPKGVLLVGPPGTGKTYLSKAVAGEAGVPFFSISGSDFVEMFVGVGASRVRDLFQDGKKNAPCIIFIDEIDAVGRRRGAGLGGGNDEREQTLNQLLVEMDGFDTNEGIIIMAATNRPDILDPAILRPGRFDRQVTVGLPNVNEREEIIKVHIRNKRIAPDVDLNALARQTAGFTPADIENMTNEAALLTARRNETIIDMKTFEEASIKVVAGPEKKSQRVIQEERVLTAYHEAGHAIVNRALPNMDVVHLITIVPRGNAGGFTSFLPEDDRSFISRQRMERTLVTFFGGRAAEAYKLDDISTGASNDIQRATEIARDMIVKYGMNPRLGPVAYESGDNNVFLGNDLGKVRSYSEQTAVAIDEEIQRVLKGAYDLALEILKRNDQLLEVLAQRLLEVETIRKEEFEGLFRQFGVALGGKEGAGFNEQ